MVNTETVAQRVTQALDGRSVRWLSEQTGIAYTTLTRRLNDGNFTTAELFKIATALKKSPASFIKAAA